jgi:Flp pilus assembly protein TadB
MSSTVCPKESEKIASATEARNICLLLSFVLFLVNIFFGVTVGLMNPGVIVLIVVNIILLVYGCYALYRKKQLEKMYRNTSVLSDTSTLHIIN